MIRRLWGQAGRNNPPNYPKSTQFVREGAVFDQRGLGDVGEGGGGGRGSAAIADNAAVPTGSPPESRTPLTVQNGSVKEKEEGALAKENGDAQHWFSVREPQAVIAYRTDELLSGDGFYARAAQVKFFAAEDDPWEFRMEAGAFLATVEDGVLGFNHCAHHLFVTAFVAVVRMSCGTQDKDEDEDGIQLNSSRLLMRAQVNIFSNWVSQNKLLAHYNRASSRTESYRRPSDRRFPIEQCRRPILGLEPALLCTLRLARIPLSSTPPFADVPRILQVSRRASGGPAGHRPNFRQSTAKNNMTPTASACKLRRFSLIWRAKEYAETTSDPRAWKSSIGRCSAFRHHIKGFGS
ncbi:hypothetical protein L226DRAFT_525082 [Lentinus tigrinus ALCF2SS1-7]|uniref:uncharacterized protein n=1 Tax=Lentinus tigrinus ALCF2SS1-7 TaxID=1328758 RepID=UPI0011662AFD|nr:hypothetical protein L226DRAFT_525082 [Lentinus tigrinus ALCF2SS1-7]